jgi:hypothetical protein
MMTHDLPPLFEVCPAYPGNPRRNIEGELGYIESKNAELLHKFPAEQLDYSRKELVESNVDVAIAKAWAPYLFTE